MRINNGWETDVNGWKGSVIGEGRVTSPELRQSAMPITYLIKNVGEDMLLTQTLNFSFSASVELAG